MAETEVHIILHGMTAPFWLPMQQFIRIMILYLWWMSRTVFSTGIRYSKHCCSSVSLWISFLSKFRDVCLLQQNSIILLIREAGTTFSWDLDDNTLSADSNPSHVYEQPGNYDVSLSSLLEGCKKKDSLKVPNTVIVYGFPTASFYQSGDVVSRTQSGNFLQRQ